MIKVLYAMNLYLYFGVIVRVNSKKKISQELGPSSVWIAQSERARKRRQNKAINQLETQKGTGFLEQEKIAFIKTETPHLWRMGYWNLISIPVLKRWYDQNQALIYWKTRQYDKYAQNKVLI